MNTKKCEKCGAVYPLSCFYKHPRMRDGYLNHCASCVKKRVRVHRSENLERINEYDRARARAPQRQAHLAELQQRSRTDPVRSKAWKITSNAIRDGRLIRPNQCSECQKDCKPEAHHSDYALPLQVEWLCRSCHCRLHRLQSLAEPLLTF